MVINKKEKKSLNKYDKSSNRSKNWDIKDLKRFYEKEAEWKKFWGSKSRRCLSENILTELPKNKSCILEIGFGDGYLASLIKRKGHKVVGIDISLERTKQALKNVPTAHFIVAEAKTLPFPNETFDIAICAETLEHVPQFENAIQEANSVLKSHGYFLVTVPYGESLIKITFPYCQETFNSMGHINFFTIESITKIMRENEFRIIKIYSFGSRIAYNQLIYWIPRFRAVRRWLDKLAQKISMNSAKWIMVLVEKNY